MAELTLAILAHAALGVLLASTIWTLGLGYLLRARDVRLPADAVFAYPVGLLVATLAAVLVLIDPWLGTLAGLLMLPAAWTLVQRAGTTAVLLGRAGVPLAWALPATLGLGAALGRLHHGPTAEVDSSAYGDMLFYSSKAVSAGQSLFPFRDLLVEGERHVWVESGWTFLNGVLAGLPGVDVVLLQAVTAPCFLVAAVAIGAGLLERRASAPLALAGLLAVAMIAYPTWVTESPPVALAVPLAFPLYGLLRTSVTTGRFAAVVGAVGADLFLTKGFGLVPFAVVAAVVLVRDHLRRALPYVLAGAVLTVAAGVLFVLTSGWLTERLGLQFLPADAARGLRRQLTTRDTQSAALAFLVAGHLLLAAALVRARVYAVAGALGASLAGAWLVEGHGFDIALGISVVLAVAVMVERPEVLRRQALLLGGAAAALLVSSWFRDIAGVRAAFLLVALLAAALVGALVARPRPLPLGAVAAAVAVGLFLGPGDRRTTLTTADYALWQRVERLVPRTGLVFTSQTGPRITGTQGWNYHPGVSGRQLYLAGWSNSRLLVDEAERARRLRLNRGVLTGALRPESLPLEGRFGSYYAVLRAGEPAPTSFLPLYRNERYVLYRIES